MKGLQFRLFAVLIMVAFIGGCTDKKLEDNLKSLERRVAQLEKKSGITPISDASDDQPALIAAGADGELPVMTFESTEYDFGTVKEGEVVDYIFRFTNTGSFPLIVSKATATCGCTVPQWPKDPVGIGESGEIRVKFNTTNRTNQQTKYVNINANTKPEVTRLKISGNVIPSQDSNS
jgi:hypothetical protein